MYIIRAVKLSMSSQTIELLVMSNQLHSFKWIASFSGILALTRFATFTQQGL